MNDLTVFQTFEEYKQTLTAELTKASESFVRIGYLLKVARDTAILAGTEYKDVNEFAQAEYNLDKTQVSRFIRINDRFSEGGNSDRLQESFRGIGYAKLSMMLLLPDALNEEITPAFSKTEVQALKEEVQAEAEVTPLERMMEPVRPDIESMTLVEKAFYELFHANQRIYADVFDGILRARPNTEDGREMLQEVLAPGGEAIHSVRIAGIGRIAISVKGLDRDVMLVNLRSNDKVPCNWDEVLDAACKFVPPEYVSAKAAYEALFGEPWQAEPEKPAVAPAQPKKETKVTKAVPDKKPAPVKPKIEPVKPAPEPVGPKEPDSGSEPEQAAQENIPAAVEKAAKSTESVAEAQKGAAQTADQAAEVAGAFAEEIRQAAPVEIPEDPAGCDGQATFNDFPEILPAPEPYRLSENARNWIMMWAHNLKTDLINLAESEKANTDTLIAAAFPLIRDELLIWHD